MKKTILSLMICFFLLSAFSFGIPTTFATDFEIIPQATEDVWAAVEKISKWWEVRDKYDEQAQKYQDEKKLGEAFASWVFTWSLVLDYLVYVIRFLSQLGILIGAVMIIYAGYIYASSIFTGNETGWWKKAITHAIIGVLVIAFSYAIMRLVTSAFIS